MSRSYWERALRRPTGRRALLRGASIAAAGVAGAALIGCGEDEEATPTPTTAPGTATPGGSTATATATATDPFAHVKRGGVLKRTEAGDPPTIDPYGNLSFRTKARAAFVYSRLYRLGTRADLNPNSALPEPDLAESAESDDAQTWVVKLRPAKFHNVAPVNGRDVTSEDVMFSWARLTAPESPNKDLVTNVVNVEAIDDQTLRFELDGPAAAFLDTLADANILWIMPPESDGGFNPATLMIGSGPWVFKRYEPSIAIEYDRNPDWFVEGKPFADGVIESIVPEYANRYSQFQAGNTHMEGINANDVLELVREQEDVQWRGLQAALLSFLYFTPADREPDAAWQDVRFRQAISMAQDRDALTDLGYNVNALRDAGLDVVATWNNLIPAGFTRWWVDPQSEEQGPSAANFAYNVEEAAKLLDAGGWRDHEFTYQYSANAYGSTFNQIAESIGNYIADAGLKPTTETQDYASQYIQQTFRGEFSGVAFGYETPFPEVGGYFPRQFGDDPANHSRWTGPEVDRIRELDLQQRAELDESQRREYIAEIQRINGEQMFYIPSQAGAGTGWTAYRPEVRGIVQTRGYGGGTESLPNFWLDA